MTQINGQELTTARTPERELTTFNEPLTVPDGSVFIVQCTDVPGGDDLSLAEVRITALRVASIN